MNLKGKRRTLFLLLAVVVLAGGYWLWQVLNAPVPQYQTLIVRPGELQQNVLATGKLDALRKVDVGAQVSGQLKTLSVEIGDKVKGQLLGVIDPEQAENQIREVEATLMELRAQRAQAQAERNRPGDADPSAGAGQNPCDLEAGFRYGHHGTGGEAGADWHD